MLCLSGDLLAEVGAVVGAEAVAEHLHLVGAVEAGDALHQVGGRVVAEVGGDVADPQTTVRRQLKHGDGSRSVRVRVHTPRQTRVNEQ